MYSLSPPWSHSTLQSIFVHSSSNYSSVLSRPHVRLTLYFMAFVMVTPSAPSVRVRLLSDCMCASVRFAARSPTLTAAAAVAIRPRRRGETEEIIGPRRCRHPPPRPRRPTSCGGTPGSGPASGGPPPQGEYRHFLDLQ